MFFRSLTFALILPIAALAQDDTSVGFGNGDFDRGAPVEVAADNLEVDQNTGRAVLTGNVVIVQADLRLSADVVVVDYTTTGPDRRIERMHATGDVLIVAGEDAAEGAEATYIIGTSEIMMSGDVVVTQAGNVLAGDELAVNLESGSGVVTGRVRSTLQP
ncbi:MAG: LptA/OstA family protein [Pseudomonadota bacterium]